MPTGTSQQGGAVDTGPEALIRRYAAGDVTWKALRDAGFEDYVAVLGLLGELGLRPPVAAMEGPNVDGRRRGRALIGAALRVRT